jgi:hypothetical protein
VGPPRPRRSPPFRRAERGGEGSSGGGFGDGSSSLPARLVGAEAGLLACCGGGRRGFPPLSTDMWVPLMVH